MQRRFTQFVSILLLALFAASCADDGDASDAGDAGDTSGTERQCQPDDFYYNDTACPLPTGDAGGGGECDQVGDGKCYARCETDADCTDPARPHCSELGLFDEGDYNCNGSVMICRSESQDDCTF